MILKDFEFSSLFCQKLKDLQCISRKWALRLYLLPPFRHQRRAKHQNLLKLQPQVCRQTAKIVVVVWNDTKRSEMKWNKVVLYKGKVLLSHKKLFENLINKIHCKISNNVMLRTIYLKMRKDNLDKTFDEKLSVRSQLIPKTFWGMICSPTHIHLI